VVDGRWRCCLKAPGFRAPVIGEMKIEECRLMGETEEEPSGDT
jgi:hypothetical protein